MGARVKLLAELHFQLPRPLSLAEARMRDVVIPDAEAALTDLQRSVQVCAYALPASPGLLWKPVLGIWHNDRKQGSIWNGICTSETPDMNKPRGIACWP